MKEEEREKKRGYEGCPKALIKFMLILGLGVPIAYILYNIFCS